jgi:hypothetical protein
LGTGMTEPDLAFRTHLNLMVGTCLVDYLD